MNAIKRRACYGRMFPNTLPLNYDQPTDGKAFRVIIQKICVGTQRRELVVKPKAWEECVDCAGYRPCYDLGMAQPALHDALEGR